MAHYWERKMAEEMDCGWVREMALRMGDRMVDTRGSQWVYW